MPTIVYLHGFNSSPQSHKIGQMRQWLQQHRPDIRLIAPYIAMNAARVAEVIAEQMALLAAAYRAERDTLAALIEREGAADPIDARPDDLRDRAVLLTATLARLVHHREAARPARWVIASPCRLR